MNKDIVQSKLSNNLKFSSDDISKLSTFHDELLKFNKKFLLSIFRSIFFPTTSEALLMNGKKSIGCHLWIFPKKSLEVNSS